jgi:MFS transporter, UMF1 family
MHIPEPQAKYPPRSAVRSWLLFDWAAQPFFTLVTTFVFAPYFTSALTKSPAEGQALWGYATAAAGLLIAVLSPVLGAIADQSGARKPWIFLFGSLLVFGCSLLWFAVPGSQNAVLIALLGYILAVIGAEFATQFSNAMMPTLVPPERIGRLSGTGWAVGYLGGMVSLVLVLGFLAANPDTGRTLLGFQPLFGLDPATRAGDRASGPFSSLWFILFVLPLFLFTPDQPKRAAIGTAVRSGLVQVGQTFQALRQMPALRRFLIANMLYADALVALFAFGGIYAAGTFGWSTIEIGIFGILLTISGTFGAWMGGKLDDRIGPKRVIAISILVLITACVLIFGTQADRLAFVFPSARPAPGDGLFATLAEQGYIVFGLLIGLVAGPLQAASRSLLLRLAPKEQAGQYFGLFALSGKVTSFAGPMLVAATTQFFDSQRAGLAVLVLLFGAGLLILKRAGQD